LTDYIDDAVAIINPAGGPLPVTLKSFSAVLSGNSVVKLNWVTSMEINSKGYAVERSTDGRNFTAVATIDGAGNTASERAYSISDNILAVTAPIVYYRLRQTDFDGKGSVSKTITVRLKKSAHDFTVSPNPFNGYVNINIDWNKNENSTVKVFNMMGREVVSKNVQLIKGTNYVPVTELSALPAGNYIIQFNDGEKRIYKQITKQ
jgi:hypothetical protein